MRVNRDHIKTERVEREFGDFPDQTITVSRRINAELRLDVFDRRRLLC